MELVKIEGERNLVREIHSKAILNIDRGEVSKYHKQKKLMEKNTSLVSDVESLKSELSEIKFLLQSLLLKE